MRNVVLLSDTPSIPARSICQQDDAVLSSVCLDAISGTLYCAELCTVSCHTSPPDSQVQCGLLAVHPCLSFACNCQCMRVLPFLLLMARLQHAGTMGCRPSRKFS